MPLSDREKAERIEQLLFERIDVCVHISSLIIITRPQPKSNRSQCSPQHNRHRYARRPAAVYAHCKRTYRVKYKKQTLLRKHFSTSESAPNTLHTKKQVDAPQKSRARANAPVPPQTKSRSASKICNSESTPVTAQARRQKDQPRHFNRRQKAHPTPRKQIYMGRDMRQCEPNTHTVSMRDGQRKLRIYRPSKLFHKKRETSPKKYLGEA